MLEQIACSNTVVVKQFYTNAKNITSVPVLSFSSVLEACGDFHASKC